MIIETEAEAKKIKQMIGMIQASTLPPLKGMDAFSIHDTCNWAYSIVLGFEDKLKCEQIQARPAEPTVKYEAPVKVKEIVKKRGRPSANR